MATLARVLTVALLVSFVLFAGSAVAQNETVSPSKSGAEGILDRLYQVVFDILLFKGGLIGFGVGLLLWGTAGNSADRATKGRQIMVGCGICVVASVSVQFLIAFLKWIAVGG